MSFPAFAHRVTVFGSTRKRVATSPGVSSLSASPVGEDIYSPIQLDGSCFEPWSDKSPDPAITVARFGASVRLFPNLLPVGTPVPPLPRGSTSPIREPRARGKVAGRDVRQKPQRQVALSPRHTHISRGRCAVARRIASTGRDRPGAMPSRQTHEGVTPWGAAERRPSRPRSLGS